MPADDVLVVDDTPTSLRLVEYILRRAGYAVRTATNAAEALAALEQSPPRLVLMDLQMPGMSGLELTRRIKADPRTRQVVVVAVTAYAMKGDDAMARDAGCDEYITKPIDKDILRATVASYLGPR